MPVIHAVTNDEIVARRDFLDLAEQVMEGLGARGALHLRARSVSSRRLYEIACWLAGWEREHGCRVVVNDRVDVARATGIEYLQLPTGSMTPSDARAVSPNLRIGASVHSVEEAVAAQRAAVDWCLVGAVYPTATHPDASPAGLELLSAVSAAVSIPVIAIGGVSPARIAELRRAGAYGVAAISGVWGSSDVGEAARGYLSQYDEYDGVH